MGRSGSSLDDVLEHHGVKGMHWGSHLSKTLEIHTRVANGTGSARDKLHVRANMSAIDFARSKGSLQAHAKFVADKLQARKDRFESGTETKTDRIERLATYNAYDFIKARNNKKQVEHFDQTLDEVLAHHGIKGQKWGVRRDRGHEGERVKTKQLAKLDKKFVKENSGSRGWVRVQNTFAKHINPMLDEMNSREEFKGKVNLFKSDPTPAEKKTNAAYLKAYEKLVEKAAAATGEELGSTPSGSHKAVVTRVGDGVDATWSVQWQDLQHDSDTPPGFTLTPVFKNGIIVSFKIEQDSMAQAEAFIENFLAHHGVKGMHWGVKRAISSVRSGHATRVAEKPAVSEDHRKAQAAKAKVKSGGTKTLSNEELQSLVSRMNLEQQLSRLNEAQPSKFQQGQSVVKKVLATGKTVNDVIAFVNSPTGKAVRSQIEKQVKKQTA